MLLLLTLGSCRNDLEDVYAERGEKGRPVRFLTEWPEDGMGNTRAITDKAAFEEGDVMQVSAVFTLMDEGGNLSEETETQYATLKLENGEWVNMAAETETQLKMEWPWNAASAVFTAYYMDKWDGPIKNNERTDPVVMDRFEYTVEDKTDPIVINPEPLKAMSGTVEYGHAVHLKFEHLCTRLTITDVGNEKEYWLKLAEAGVLKNACVISLKDNILSHEFVNEESDKVASLVEVIQVANEEGVMEDKRAVTFHLEPGNYSRFKLTRRNGYSYLTISGVNALAEMKAGDAYTISLEKLKGNVTPDDKDDDWWSEREPEPIEAEEFNVKDFMEAIQACNKDYICELDNGETITLLEYDPTRKEMLLTADVDFKGASFTPVELKDMTTFDGGRNYIIGLAGPMFQEMRGTVRNLYLTNAILKHDKTSLHTEDNHGEEWGILGRIGDGMTVENVRLRDATLDIELHESNDKSYKVGALIGWVKDGVLREITLGDNVSVTVRVEEEEATQYITSVGGVVGECSGTLTDVRNMSQTPGSNPVIKVMNNCQGYSTRYTGGIVGLLADGELSNCEVNAVVDASQATGTWNYTGGAVGGVRSTGGAALIADVIVSGKVTGGGVVGVSSTHSATGGLVGNLQASSVTGGVAYSSVDIAITYEAGTNTYYTIGGVIGTMTGAQDISKNEGRNQFDATRYTHIPGYVAGAFSAGTGNWSELEEKENSTDGKGLAIGSDPASNVERRE